MGSRREPSQGARRLRRQVDGQIQVVKALAERDPHEKLDPELLRRIFPIVRASQERYGDLLILDTLLTDMILGRSGNEPTASVMWSSLVSLSNSLLDIEEDEALEETFGSPTPTGGASYWGSAAQHLDLPPGEPEDGPGEEGRGYWTGAGGQHRRAVANRSRQRPW
jgi:hypothetical protein